MNSRRVSFSHSTAWHDREANKEKDLKHLKASLRKNKGLLQLGSIYCVIILHHYCTLKGVLTTGARTINWISRRAELISMLDHTLWRSDLWPLCNYRCEAASWIQSYSSLFTVCYKLFLGAWQKHRVWTLDDQQGHKNLPFSRKSRTLSSIRLILGGGLSHWWLAG